MPRGKQSQGKCAYCSKEISKGSVKKHLATCAQRQEKIAATEQKKGTCQTINEEIYPTLDLDGLTFLDTVDRDDVRASSCGLGCGDYKLDRSHLRIC